jgi:hypothetical protein
MAGSKKGERRGGRQKGSRNKTTIDREQRAMKAVAALAASVVPNPADADRKEVPGTAGYIDITPKHLLPDRSEPPSTVAPTAISPKDLLLTAMQNAWSAGCEKSAQARALEAQATVVEAEIAGLNGSALAPEIVEQIKVKVGTLEGLQKRVNALRGEAGALITLATELATDVAPFVHPKMASVDSKASGNVRIVIREF